MDNSSFVVFLAFLYALYLVSHFAGKVEARVVPLIFLSGFVIILGLLLVISRFITSFNESYGFYTYLGKDIQFWGGIVAVVAGFSCLLYCIKTPASGEASE